MRTKLVHSLFLIYFCLPLTRTDAKGLTAAQARCLSAVVVIGTGVTLSSFAFNAFDPMNWHQRSAVGALRQAQDHFKYNRRSILADYPEVAVISFGQLKTMDQYNEVEEILRFIISENAYDRILAIGELDRIEITPQIFEQGLFNVQGETVLRLSPKDTPSNWIEMIERAANQT